MLLFVEHQSNQPLPKAEDCDEVNEVPSGVTMLQVSVPRHGGGGGGWLAGAVLPAKPLIPATNHQLCWSFIAKKPLLKTFCFPPLHEGMRCSHLTWLSLALASLWEVGMTLLIPWHIPGGVSVSFQHPYPWNQSSFDGCSSVASTAPQSSGKDAFLGSDLYWNGSLTVCHALSTEQQVRRHGQSHLPRVWGHATTPHPSYTESVSLFFG